MKKQSGFIFAFTTALFFSCGSPSVEQKKEAANTDSLAQTNVVETAQTDCAGYYRAAKKADSVLLVATSMNMPDAEKAIEAFNSYSSFCKDKAEAAVYLLKGGQVARSVGKYTVAQAMLKQCANDFPEFKDRGAALFLLAQLYDEASMLNNEAEAKTLYLQIIKEYPKTAYADDAKAALNNLGKTDEQLVQEFLKKNK
jgi:TolA-binding protein